MALQNKSKLFAKTKNIKTILVPLLFFFTFVLVFFNKTEYFLIDKMKSTGVNVINPISKVISYPVNFVFNTASYISELRIAQKENIKLKEEIIRLKKWQILALKNNRENEAYKKLLNSTTNEIKVLKTTSVVQYSPTLYLNSIMINAGHDHQIKNNLAVINERGLVGKTILVTKNKSKVLLINDQNSSIPVKSHNGNFYAIMKGSPDGKYLVSSFIKNNKKPLIGDILVTSGNVDIYPKNILVGKIIKVLNDRAIAIPFVDTKNIEFVQVVSNN